MLDFVRNKQKSIIIKIAFAVIILSFVIGYAMLSSPGGQDDDPATSAAAIVNGNVISFNDFQTTYSNLYQLYQNIYQDQFSPALERELKLADKSLNSLIDQVLLMEEAQRLGLEVSKQELVDAIAQIEVFQQDGQFSKERYLQVLSYQRMTSDQFETMQRNELLVQKVRDRLQEGVTVTQQDIIDEFRARNDKINLAFVKLAPERFESQVKVSDDSLQAYYAEQQEVFRVPEMVSLRYLVFAPARYLDEVTFTEEDQQKYYRRHLDQFDIPEQVKASHILIKVGQDADPKTKSEKKAFAEKLLADIKAGKDFAELARLHSDDKASAVKGGDLDFFTRGTMVPAFEQAAFNMQPGEVSEIVETSFGFHIIKVEAYIEPGVKKLDDVRDEVQQGLREEMAEQLAFEKAMDAYNINRKTGDLAAAAASNELGLKETGLFTRDGYIDGIGRNDEIIKTAFVLDDDTLARPVITDDGVILFAIKERAPSHIPELSEVKDLVTAAYKRQEAIVLAKAAAEELLKGLKDGKGFKSLTQKIGVDVEETGEFTRSYIPFIPRLGNSEELATAAFDLPADQSVIDEVFTVENRYVVATVKDRQPADMEELNEAKRQELETAILTREQNEAVEKHLDGLRQAATIEIMPRVQALLDKEN